MKSIRLICFGDSKKNLEKAIQYNVIGTKRNIAFDKSGEQLYFVLKESGEWKICARAISGAKTDIYPFEDGNAYYTFKVANVERCNPFEIKNMCQQYLGPYYGLKLQQPSKIEATEFINVIENSFEENRT